MKQLSNEETDALLLEAIEEQRIKREIEKKDHAAVVLMKERLAQQKGIMWSELKAELHRLCAVYRDAIEIEEKRETWLLIKAKENKQESDIWFGDNHIFGITHFYTTKKGLMWNSTETHLGDIRCKLANDGTPYLTPGFGIRWTPKYLAFLIVMRLVANRHYVELED